MFSFVSLRNKLSDVSLPPMTHYDITHLKNFIHYLKESPSQISSRQGKISLFYQQLKFWHAECAREGRKWCDQSFSYFSAILNKVDVGEYCFYILTLADSLPLLANWLVGGNPTPSSYPCVVLREWHHHMRVAMQFWGENSIV